MIARASPCLPAGAGRRRRRGPGWAAALPLCLALGAAAGPARAETIDQAYQQALKHYYDGQYLDAVAELERILAVPVQDPDLHYNLGCANFKLGRMGPAIFHFEKALQADPDAEDALFNLETSRALVASQVKDELKGATAEAWWVRLVRLLSARSWAVLFLVLWWLCLGVLLALRWIAPGPARAGLVVGDSFLAGLVLVCGLLLLGRVHLDHRVTQAIVLPQSMAVREGPGVSTRQSFKLHAGFRVRVQGKRDGWARIRLPNGLEGWVPTDQLGIL